MPLERLRVAFEQEIKRAVIFKLKLLRGLQRRDLLLQARESASGRRTKRTVNPRIRLA